MKFCPNCGEDLTKYGESVKVDPFDTPSVEQVKDLLKDKLDKADDAMKLIKDVGVIMAQALKKTRNEKT